MPDGKTFSDYIIYVDESGDHSLTSIDEDYPLFVLAFCIANKSEYCENIVPAFQKMKFDYFGHDMAIFHGHDIRKSEGEFRFLFDQKIREKFFADLNVLIDASPLTLVATVINKLEYSKKFEAPRSPYVLSLQFCMERSWDFLLKNEQNKRLTHIIVESRGKKEDEELELEFRRICQNEYDKHQSHKRDYSEIPFEIRFVDKRSNSTGLQLADMIAHPIGRHVLKPDQANRAFEVIEPKLLEKPSGGKTGMGLKIFP